jgi:uncharacterized ion transporter superfamily protein YfcC
MNNHQRSPKWYERLPHALVLLSGIVLLVTAMTYFVPAGKYERTVVDGKNVIVPDSYETISNTPVGLLGMFKAIPLGFKAAVEIVFIVLVGGMMFSVLETSKAIENSIGTLIKHLGSKYKYLIVVLMTFAYGGLGVAVGYENNIGIVPIAAVLSLALGGDLILAAGISVGALTIGFGLSPINPYTVGTGHKIAELPLFSGALLRSLLCFSALTVMAYFNVCYLKRISQYPEEGLGLGLNQQGIELAQPIEEYRMTSNNWLVLSIFLFGIATIIYGVFQLDWYINDLSAVFLMVTLAVGVAARIRTAIFIDTVLKGISIAVPGAFMVGYASAVKVIMEMGNISDSISHQLAQWLQGLPIYAAAITMSIVQSIINFFIPSGSGQALATLPVMIPLGELLGLTRQTTILAFQIGDGVTNLVNPTLGGLIAMLSLCRVPLDRWLRFIAPVVVVILGLTWLTLIIAVAIGYE